MNVQDVSTDGVPSGALDEAAAEAVGEEEIEEIEELEAEEDASEPDEGGASPSGEKGAADACEPEPCDLDDEDMEELSPEDGEGEPSAADGRAAPPSPAPPSGDTVHRAPVRDEASSGNALDPRKCFQSQSLADEAAGFLGGKAAATPSAGVNPGDEWLSHGLFGYAPFGVRCSADTCRQDVEFSPIASTGNGGR